MNVARHDSIRDYLADQHVVFDLGLSAVGRAVAAGALVDAHHRIVSFGAHLDRYVRGEERVLFPIYERVTMARREPTLRMRQEHGRLRRMVGAIARLLERGDVAGSLATLGALRSVLVVHGAKEDWVIYPEVADALPVDREEELVRALREGRALAAPSVH